MQGGEGVYQFHYPSMAGRLPLYIPGKDGKSFVKGNNTTTTLHVYVNLIVCQLFCTGRCLLGLSGSHYCRMEGYCQMEDFCGGADGFSLVKCQ